MILCWTDLSAFVGVVWFHLLHFDTLFRYRLYLMDFMAQYEGKQQHSDRSDEGGCV